MLTLRYNPVVGLLVVMDERPDEGALVPVSVPVPKIKIFSGPKGAMPPGTSS